MSGTDLGAAAVEGYSAYGWYAGIGNWQYTSDTTGATIAQAAGGLMSLCQQNNNCN